MSAPSPTPDDRDPADAGDTVDAGAADPARARPGWLERRRDKITAEVARNRRGDYTVPTWVLAAALLLIVGAWAALVVLS